MSLRREPVPPIPEETVRVVRAAFAEGTVHTRLRDELDVLYADQGFVGLFAVRGRPAVAPWRLAMVLVMQVMEGLSDRQAAQAVRARIDWKYALGLELEDRGFDYLVLSEFRGRVVAGGVEQQLLEVLLGRAKERGLLTAGGRQRTDATHVLAQIRVLNRLERVGETLRVALEALAVAAPAWLAGGCRTSGMTAMTGERRSRGCLTRRPSGPGWPIRSVPMGCGCSKPSGPRGAWLAAGTAGGGVPSPGVDPAVLPGGWAGAAAASRVAAAGQPAGGVPHEPQARYRRKREIEWVGYKRHLTETCDVDRPHLITGVQTTVAPVQDVTVTPKVHRQLAAQQLLPAVHLVDSAYVDADGLCSAQASYGVRLHGPVGADTSWQARAGQGYDLASFGIDWAAEQAICPQGKPSVQWVPHHDADGRAWIQVAFASADCQGCPTRTLCTRSARKPRQLSLQPQPVQQALWQARAAQQTPAWRKAYAQRAGVEGTISQTVCAFGGRRCRWRGLPKAHLESVLIAVAVNLVRLDAWLLGRPLARTRTSHLARLRPVGAPSAA